MSQIIKLITEDNFSDINIVNESQGDDKRWYITGVYAEHSTPNRNKRIYEESTLDREFDKFQKLIAEGRAIGETNHPQRIEPDPNEASHRIVEVRKEGKYYIGKSLVLNTPKGQIMQGLLEGGYKAGVSTRGAGSLMEAVNGVRKVADNYRLSTVDIVHAPSAIDAFVDGIYEGASWIFEGDSYIQVEAEKAQRDLKQMQAVNEAKLHELVSGFLNKIKFQ